MTNCVACGKTLLDNETCTCGMEQRKAGAPAISIALYVVAALGLFMGGALLLAGVADPGSSGSLEISEGAAAVIASFLFFALAAIVSSLAALNRNLSVVAGLLANAARERSTTRTR